MVFKMFVFKLILFTIFILNILADKLRLYPKESETREVKLLNGFWNFRVIPSGVDQNIGFTQKWYSQPLEQTGDVIPMPVPSSFNDITQSRFIRDYAGWVWYDLSFFVPKEWDTKSVTLRFGSAHYTTIVYINGVNFLNHTGGHLPFESYVTNNLKYGTNNLITVALNNELSASTIPPGAVTHMNGTDYPKDFYETKTSFDFFNYAGIHRSVFLYVLPKDHIKDITILTDIKDLKTGIISYNVEYMVETAANYECVVDVFNKEGDKVSADNKGFNGSITIPNANFWWPYTTDPNPGYLYTIRVSLRDKTNTIDVYYLRVGIRTVKITGTKFFINGKEFYFRGFGKHEDANIRGKGLDLPIIVKDFNLIKWIGANSFRTSHYPYSEELMDLADEQGIVVIDECPAIGLTEFNDVLLNQHLMTLTELIQRDKNHPSVVMWSIANEPNAHVPTASDYFKEVSAHVRSLDQSRPITAATHLNYDNDLMSVFLDVLMINRYYGWYSYIGYPQVIEKQVTINFEKWFDTHNKPMMISEYGADTVAGLHQDPSFVFSEDYESEFIMNYHKAFDTLIAKGFFIGEHIWNFADFMTDQKPIRVVGNKKGIFTRERQPKAAARVLRCRYWKLAPLKVEQHSGFSYCPIE